MPGSQEASYRIPGYVSRGTIGTRGTIGNVFCVPPVHTSSPTKEAHIECLAILP